MQSRLSTNKCNKKSCHLFVHTQAYSCCLEYQLNSIYWTADRFHYVHKMESTRENDTFRHMSLAKTQMNETSTNVCQNPPWSGIMCWPYRKRLCHSAKSERSFRRMHNPWIFFFSMCYWITTFVKNYIRREQEVTTESQKLKHSKIFYSISLHRFILPLSLANFPM